MSESVTRYVVTHIGKDDIAYTAEAEALADRLGSCVSH
jgi:hypothetical protein